MKTKLALIVLSVLALVLVTFRVLAVGKAASHGADDARPPLVPAARVSRGDVSQIVVLTGTIRAKNAVEVHPELPGRIESVHARVGDRVRAGQVLAVVGHDEIAWQAKAARAAVDLAKAGLEGARLEHVRTQELHAGGAAPQAQLDGARVRLALAEAQLAQAEAAAGLAEEQVKNARIESPIAGIVTRRGVDVGAQVGPQTAAFSVEDVSELKLESAVDAADWARLALGARAEVVTDARPGEVFHGQVRVLSPSLDPASRRALVEVAIEDGAGKLLPGTFARATVEAARVEGALVLPREALVEAAGGVVVWRLAGGKAAAVRPRLGAGDESRVVVLEGLAEGDLVATAGQASLAEGAPATAAEQVIARGPAVPVR